MPEFGLPPNVDGEGASGPVAGQLALAAGLVPPRSLRLREPVWGIDVSTLRVAVAMIACDGVPAWTVKSMPTGHEDEASRFSGALWACTELMLDIKQKLKWPLPAAIMVEEPFGFGGRQVHPSSNRMLGVLLAVLGTQMPCPVSLMGPGSWKKLALGAGHGAAKKPEILEWARQAGYTGSLEDEADAIGIATAQAVALQV